MEYERFTKEAAKENQLLVDILYEFKNNIKNGIYGLLQKSLAYNSNRIEGSKLTEDQTVFLFDTREMLSEGSAVRSMDIEELTGHFIMFNYMLKTIDETLSISLLKEFHRCLKSGVFEGIANGYTIGDFKKKPNFIELNGICHPNLVESEILELLNWYGSLNRVTLKEIAMFHSRYEKIHPFQDGNGRTGRIILLRELLVNRLCPVIIREETKEEYILSIRDEEKLFDYLIKEQDHFYNRYLEGYYEFDC